MALVLVIGASALLFASSAASHRALPRRAQLIDCTCYDLYSIRPNASGRHLLSKGNSRNLFDISASRTRILWAHSINILSISTLTATGLRNLATGNDIHSARFSPDGTKVLYSEDGAASMCTHAALHVLDLQ